MQKYIGPEMCYDEYFQADGETLVVILIEEETMIGRIMIEGLKC